MEAEIQRRWEAEQLRIRVTAPSQFDVSVALLITSILFPTLQRSITIAVLWSHACCLKMSIRLVRMNSVNRAELAVIDAAEFRWFDMRRGT